MSIVHIPLKNGTHINEINTKKKRNVHGQREKFAFGTQRNLYSPDLHLGLALGVTQILGLASGVTQIFTFFDSNKSVFPRQNSGIEGLDQRKNVASQWNIGFKIWI